MVTKRKGLPYSQFSFQVLLGEGATERPHAGFQEVSGLGMEISAVEPRTRDTPENSRVGVSSTAKTPDVTFKRGLLGRNDLYSWLNDARSASGISPRTVTIVLMSEDRASAVRSWKLVGARPVKYTGPTMSGKGTDVAVDELVLAADSVEIS